MKKFVSGLALILVLLIGSGIQASAAEKEEGYYTVLAGCNLRRTPSIEGVIVTVVKEGEVVYFLGSRAGDYSFVRFGDIEGYVFSGVIGDPAGELESADKDEAEEIVVPESIELTETADTEVIEEAEPQAGAREDVQALAARRALRISMGQKIGEGSRNLIEEETVTLEKGHILATVNFRSGPDLKSRAISLIPEGEIVDIEEGGNAEFAKVSYNGETGYVYKKCIDFETVTETRESSNGWSGSTGGNRIATSAMLSGLIIGSYEMDLQQEAEAVRDAVREDEQMMQAEVAARQLIAKNEIKEATVGGKKISSVIPDIAGQAMPGSGNTVSMVQYNGLNGAVKVDDSTLNGQAPEVADGDMFELTAYCTCKKCCGNFSPEVTGLPAHTATGTTPTQGRTIAVDPKVIPYGSTVVIDGVGTFVAEDTGGAIKNNRIDVYFETHEDAIAFGRMKKRVVIIK